MVNFDKLWVLKVVLQFLTREELVSIRHTTGATFLGCKKLAPIPQTYEELVPIAHTCDKFVSISVV